MASVVLPAPPFWLVMGKRPLMAAAFIEAA
jgi:hypothetical protein